jgi:hypothetical protein
MPYSGIVTACNAIVSADNAIVPPGYAIVALYSQSRSAAMQQIETDESLSQEPVTKDVGVF